jgi:endonuclease III
VTIVTTTMKTATKRADELKALIRKATREHKPEPFQPMEPLIALIKGILAYDVSDDRAAEAWAALDREFVDPNELRVATELELQDLIGQRYPAVEERAALLVGSLNAIFEREHTLNLDRLKETKKAETRQFLRDLPGMNPFVEAYTFLFGYSGTGAVPVDQTMSEYLAEQGIFEPGVAADEVQKFIEHHVKADEAYDAFAALRAAALARRKK